MGIYKQALIIRHQNNVPFLALTLETLIQDRFIGVNNRVKMKLRLAHASFVITPFYYNMF